MMKAVLFDFDGVIVDSELLRYEVLNDILVEAGYKKISIPLSEFSGKKTEKILADCFPDMNKNIMQDIISRRRERQELPKLMPKIKELLKYLKPRCKLAIVTGSQESIVSTVIKHYSLPDFDLLVTGDKYGKSKENPECYILALKELSIEPKDAIAIEDSQAGVDSAKYIKVFGIETYSKLERADMLFKDHASLLTYLREHY
jgi:HAD superfamily hydrolase (TIGR01509 family)